MGLCARVALAGLICCVASTAWAQQTIYVNGTTGDDAWDGLCEEWDGDTCGPKATIQAGIDVAVDGDTVVVADGTYTGDGNKDLDFEGRAITVVSDNGPETCIIDCEGSGRGFYFRTGEGEDSVVDGFTIRNGFAGFGGGVYCRDNSSPTISNCTISGNSATIYGGGVSFYQSSPTLINCTISGNRSNHRGGGVYCNQSSPTITNCTISGNSATSYGGGVYCTSGSPMITNCILWGDAPQEIYGNPVVTYCDVQGGWDGEGNIDTDPQFAFEDDPHLMPGSPCIDAGTHSPPGGLPPDDLDGTPRPLDGDGDASAIADMGAYEFNPDAPSIALSPTELKFYGPQGGPNPEAQVLSIRNCGGTTLGWQVVESCSWLSVSPTSGQSAGEVDDVTVSVDTTGLGWGEYRCVLEVCDAAAVNSPRWVAVMLYVNETLHMPAEYTTIQAAIDATVDGDTVVVADGTYTGEGNKNLDFDGKAITVRSENGPKTCIIDCEGSGRGFYFHAGEGLDSVVDGFTIRNGSVTDSGGGVRCHSGSPTITNCKISGNSPGASGGGIYCFYSSPTIANCTISGNSAGSNGGGVYCSHASNATITNCTISGNSGSYGGGVFCYYYSSPTITNCTITENSAACGGGVYCTYYCSPTITNSILWNDTPEEIYVDDSAGSPSSPVVTYCDVQGGWDGEGNIDADPQFAFEDDPHLMPGSPCIDAGTHSPPGGMPAEDLDGNPRPLDGDGDATAVVDMGAYEFNSDAPSIALSPTEVKFNGAQGGLDPEAQVLSIRNCGGAMLDWEVVEDCSWLSILPTGGQSTGEVDEVTVSVDTGGLGWGEYRCEMEVSDEAAVNSPRRITVILYVNQTLHVPADYATIQGGIDAAVDGDTVIVAEGTYTGDGNKDLDFGGKVLTVRSESGPETCVIDCEGSGRGFYFQRGEDEDSVVDGFTICSGSVSDSGGGVRCSGLSSPTFRNCVISGNSAASGGGFHCWGSPTITSCTISGNWSDNQGGGIYCSSGGNPAITDCTITGNSAVWHGGGVYCSSGDPTIMNCMISGNLAGYYGAGVYCSSSTNLTITHSTISGNSASQNGGGVYCSDYASPTITNCILWDDAPQEIYVSSGSPVVTYCDVEGGWSGEGNIDADPLFVDPDGPDDDPSTWEDNDYRLSAGSPCIDAGNNDALPPDASDLDGDGDTDEPIPVDLDGHARILYGTVDMGAYEFGIGDFDGNQVVDLMDFASWDDCMTGPGGEPYAPGCEAFDFEYDSDVDLADFADFQAAFVQP